MSNTHILFSFSGPDYPGITHNLTKVIVSTKQTIVDIGQSVTHNLLSLSLLIEITNPVKELNLIKDLLFEARRLNLSLEYKIIEDNLYFPWYDYEKFILNCISTETISPDFVLGLSGVMAQQNINIIKIDNVHPNSFKCLEITTTLPPDVDLKTTKEALMKLSTTHKVDIAFLKDNVFRRSKRLICVDMDSTLIQSEVIDDMGAMIGKSKEISTITEQAMNGEIEFSESLRKRVSLLKGLNQEQLKQVLDGLNLTPGVEQFIQTVKSLGYKVAIISGGFSYFSNALKEKLGLDYAFANELEIDNGVLTGQIKGPIVDAHQKAVILNLIAQQEKITMEQVVAIGDGANDLPMLAQAGLGIAFHAKDIVRQKAGHHMSHGPMTGILYFLGIPGPMKV